MDKLWTEQELGRLPAKNGFRLRGEEMTRLETFCDAAFAFAVTLLVISIDGIPRSYAELLAALKGIPTFAASFATITSFWVAHRRWSRRYGLEDGWSTLISLILVFVMLVFVYPLKMVFSALFAWISGGRLPTEFVLRKGSELQGIFRIYGLGFMTMTGTLALLYRRALSAGRSLRLNEYERVLTREEITEFSIMAATGLASALFAWLMPPRIALFAGFIYATLLFTMPAAALLYSRRSRAAASAGA
jgi:uncharacterized membrane protein